MRVHAVVLSSANFRRFNDFSVGTEKVIVANAKQIFYFVVAVFNGLYTWNAKGIMFSPVS